MAQMMTSGEVLREARERQGYELATVARRLRIRPDILRAIEEGDFNSMPPKGYARNMVNAYARLLGLNATDIVNMYLDEVYAHQVSKARKNTQGTGFIMEPDTRRSRLRSNREASRTGSTGTRATASSYGYDNRDITAAMPAQEAPVRRGTRHLYDDRTQFSRDDYGVARNTANRNNGNRDFISNHSGYSGASYTLADDRSRSRRGQRTIHVGQTPMEYSAPRLPRVFQSRLAVAIAIAAVLVLILVVVFFVFLRGGSDQQEDVPAAPISGVADTTDDSSSSSAAVEVAPTSARIIYSVASGQQCYVETYSDGKFVSGEELTGPKENSVETTTTWTITTWSPESLKVTVDGEEVTLTPSDEYGGMYAYTVDFAKILQEWNKTHASTSSTREAAVASAQSAAARAQSEAAAQAAAEAQQAQEEYTEEYMDDAIYQEDELYYDDSSYYSDDDQVSYE